MKIITSWEDKKTRRVGVLETGMTLLFHGGKAKDNGKTRKRKSNRIRILFRNIELPTKIVSGVENNWS